MIAVVIKLLLVSYLLIELSMVFVKLLIAIMSYSIAEVVLAVEVNVTIGIVVVADFIS